MKKGNFVMPKVTSPNLSKFESSLVFCRKDIPIIAKKVRFNGQDCMLCEGFAMISENIGVKITVKEDNFTTNNGNEIVYRVTLCGFDQDRNQSTNGMRIARMK